MYQPKVLDPRCDLVFDFDVKSRLFGAAPTEERFPVNRLWMCEDYFDQGTEGACAGFAGGHAMVCDPIATSFNQDACFDLYNKAKKRDHIEGEDYSGTTLLGVGKALLHDLKIIERYEWCFGLRDIIMTVGFRGPVVLGVTWYEGMSKPSVDGLIRPTGKVVGGHAIMVQGVNVDFQYAVLHNSWGKDWGHGGNCYILFSDLEYLLSQMGQAMFLKEITPLEDE